MKMRRSEAERLWLDYDIVEIEGDKADSSSGDFVLVIGVPELGTPKFKEIFSDSDTESPPKTNPPTGVGVHLGYKREVTCARKHHQLMPTTTYEIHVLPSLDS
jgi:hypothetical protein